MKKQITAKEVLDLINVNEMARIGFAGKNKDLEIRVYEEPLKNPSIHVLSKSKNYEVVLEIRTLKILEWKKKGKIKNDKVPYNDLKSVVDFLNTIDEDGELNWKFLWKTWIRNNPTLKKQLELEMPDYNNILKNLK